MTPGGCPSPTGSEKGSKPRDCREQVKPWVLPFHFLCTRQISGSLKSLGFRSLTHSNPNLSLHSTRFSLAWSRSTACSRPWVISLSTCYLLFKTSLSAWLLRTFQQNFFWRYCTPEQCSPSFHLQCCSVLVMFE